MDARLRLIYEYFQEHHGNLVEDCQQAIQAILIAHDAIYVDQDNQVAQEQLKKSKL